MDKKRQIKLQRSFLRKTAKPARCWLFCFFIVQYRQTRLAIDLPISNLKHRLALIDSSPKKVSSSAAHAEVRSSLPFNGLAGRAEKRFTDLVKAIEEQYRHKMILRFFQKNGG